MMRFAEKGDFPAVRALWETCFPDEGGFNVVMMLKVPAREEAAE